MTLFEHAEHSRLMRAYRKACLNHRGQKAAFKKLRDLTTKILRAELRQGKRKRAA